MSETELYENPLVPNAKLKQMYVAMAEARVLDEHVAGSAKRGKGANGRRGAKGSKTGRELGSIRGQEACRVSTAIDLGPGDLVSDSCDHVAGAGMAGVLQRLHPATAVVVADHSGEAHHCTSG